MQKKTQIKKKNPIDWKIIVTGLICLTVIEVCALFNGIDGTLMTLVIGIIALALGIAIPSPIRQN